MTRTRRSRRWSNDLFVRHPWTRYAVAALFMSIVAIRAGFVLDSYPPSSWMAWIALAAGTVVSVTLVGLAVWRSKPTLELGRHPAYVALMIISICIIGFGLCAGLDWTSADLSTWQRRTPLRGTLPLAPRWARSPSSASEVIELDALRGADVEQPLRCNHRRLPGDYLPPFAGSVGRFDTMETGENPRPICISHDP